MPRQGPFDGLLGFSQGGVFASFLCGLGATRPAFQFKFVLIFSGYAASAEAWRNYIPFAGPPFLHCFGMGPMGRCQDTQDRSGHVKLSSIYWFHSDNPHSPLPLQLSLLGRQRPGCRPRKVSATG